MAGSPIPNYLVGRNCSAFYGAGLLLNSSGNIVPASDVSDFHSLGILNDFEYSFNPGNAEISALDASIENNIPTKAKLSFSVSEIQQPGGSSKLLNVLFTSSTLFGIEVYTTDPATGSGAYMAIMGRFDDTGGGLKTGKNVIKASFVSAGIFPYYSTFNGGGLAAAQSGGISSGNIRTGHIVTGVTGG